MYIYIFKVREGQGKGIDVYDKGLGHFEGNEIEHNAMDGIVIKTSAFEQVLYVVTLKSDV